METDNLTVNNTKKKNLSLKKKLNIIFSTYHLTYKSLHLKTIIYFWIFFVMALTFLILGINSLSTKFLITIPTYGGTWNEGIIGTPRYINPVLANSLADKDLTSLVYSGLFKKNKDGYIVNDLASDIEESEDHMTFTVKINDKAKFQDGKKITADDIIFTVLKIEDKDINSPLAINFEGIDVEKIDDTTIVFHLKKPYIYFKESLTFGILPKHIWSNLSNDEFSLSINNINPIGSGPYKVLKVVKNSNNIPTKYSLIQNENYISGRPYINNINIFIYQNNNDLLASLNSGNIDGTNYLNQNYFNKILNKNKEIISSSLSNLYSISFNPSKNPNLINLDTRSALNLSINKQEIINTVFSGYSRKIDFIFSNDQEAYNYASDLEVAKKLLIKRSSSTNKNKITETLDPNMELSLTTVDIDDLKKVANEIAKYWESLGVKVTIKVYSLSDIGDIIKKRDFEALLFGSIINYDTDLYAYWHSTQRIYPGLNITGYTSKNLDKNLETLKNSLNIDSRNKAFDAINKELNEELQSIPLYSNNSNYIINKKEINIKEYIPLTMLNENERFINIEDWYIYKEKVWKVSYKKNLIEKLQNIIH
ncbi:MAG: hypothetical protein KBD12_02235 [Candidatus Pacebacteria bacterium]|nr:hypothetical protein [Candidatus Paceibacterota bacterium]